MFDSFSPANAEALTMSFCGFPITIISVFTHISLPNRQCLHGTPRAGEVGVFDIIPPEIDHEPLALVFRSKIAVEDGGGGNVMNHAAIIRRGQGTEHLVGDHMSIQDAVSARYLAGAAGIVGAFARDFILAAAFRYNGGNAFLADGRSGARGTLAVQYEIEDVLLGIAGDLAHLNDVKDGRGKIAEVGHERFGIGFGDAGASGGVAGRRKDFGVPFRAPVMPFGGIAGINCVILVIGITGIGVIGLQAVIRVLDVLIKRRNGAGYS